MMRRRVERWTDVSTETRRRRTKPISTLDSLALVPVTQPQSMTEPITTAVKHYLLCETLISGLPSPQPCLTEQSAR